MPCSEFLDGRPEKSVPPKKSLSWRLHGPTLPDSAPGNGENPNMGPSHLRPELRNGDAFRPTSSTYEDAPLDFSLKQPSKNRLQEDRREQPGKTHSFAHPFGIPNGDRNGRHVSHSPNETRPRYCPNDPESVRGPARNSDCFDSNRLADFGARFSPVERTHSPSPPMRSPSSSSKSPILAGMLSGLSSDILSGMPAESLDPRLLPFGVVNGYPGKVPDANSVMVNPSLSNLLVAPFLQPVNLLPPVPLQSKMDLKLARKAKQERPFKNYDISLQDDLQCNPLPWPAMPTVHPRPANGGSPPEVRRSGSAASPHQNVNGHCENSLHSDPISVAGELDTSLPNNGLEESDCGRKRKPVADSEKDANYWERRKKNNQAAKRSRENRRIKEDTVAQQALYFRSETARLSQLLLHMNARIHDANMKCASLEQDKLALTAENAMYKQSLSQKRCRRCGHPVDDKHL